MAQPADEQTKAQDMHHGRRLALLLDKVDQQEAERHILREIGVDVRGIIFAAAGKPRDAVESFNRMKTLAPWNLCFLAICHVELGEMTKAQAYLEKFKALDSGKTPEEQILEEPYSDKATLQRLIDAFRRAKAAAASS